MTTSTQSAFRHRNFCGASLALLAFLAGCGKQELVSYRVPKEKDATLPVTVASSAASAPTIPVSTQPVVATPGAAGMNATPVATAAGPGLTWTAPAPWQTKPLGAMRKGSFAISGDAGATADLSITAFPGAVGGEFANVNRWRGQLGLAPISEAELPANVTHLAQNGLTFTLVDFAGTDATAPQRMLGAMVPFEGAMWFFKLSGPDALVAATKPAFLEFLKSVKAPLPTP